ncbi:YhdP family protein [uncultured Aquitalea sp.]|uniref:YhdP family protein n=1 Tax=uncultured Aquitalea sp. TaxID=540272 RepID=UPI0025F56E4C|nr:YhdP family protein [uncultured Aquitalea sp.]
MEKHSAPLSGIHVVATVKRLLKIAGALLALAAFVVSSSFAVFTWWFLPRLDEFRPRLEQELSRSMGRTVSIGELSGYWDGVAPLLELKKLRVANPATGAALTLGGVSVAPSWWSIPAREPVFSHIVVDAPSVELIRDADGGILLNGMDLLPKPQADQSEKGGEPAANWLLRQYSIEVRNARLSWQDQRLGLPRLDLQQGRLLLTRSLFGHRLKLSGQPVATLGRAFDLDMSWRGDDFADWMNWAGSAKVTLSGARPGMLSRYLAKVGLINSGEGDGVVEAEFAEGRINSLTADVSVRNASYTPKDAHALVLPVLSGKLAVTRNRSGAYDVKASDLTLASASGLAFDHSSIKGEWLPGDQGRGELTLDNVNVAHLTPFLHALGGENNPLLTRFAPSGHLRDLSLSWRGPAQSPSHYAVATRFEQLGWQPFGHIPGVSGAGGRLTLDEAGGRLELDSGKSAVSYPQVFPQPLSFDSLQADVGWQVKNGAVAVGFKSVRFANADLKGSFGGNYHNSGNGAGTADFTASIDAVPAARVPAYLPHAVGEHTMRWLEQALQAGTARNVRMVLKGDLDHFPFAGGKGGEFKVDADVEDARLLFEKGWPTLDGIRAGLSFHNERMDVSGRAVSTAGVPLHDVLVSIDNLAAPVPMLAIKGKAQDSLQKMLRYTAQSPVDGWLDGFTGQIAASGDAGLDLDIAIPLAGEGGPKVKGDIKLAGNRLDFKSLPVPPLHGARGTLTFTEQGVESKGVQLDAMGGHFLLKAATAKGGRMSFDIAGDADSAQVMKQYLPILQPYVSGHSAFGVKFDVAKGLENLSVTSSLAGTAISAPAPAAKPAEASWPLQLSLQPGKTSQQPIKVDFSVGNMAWGNMLLSGKGDFKSGVVALGRDTGAMPADGLTIRIASRQLVLADWVGAISKRSFGAGGGKNVSLDLPLTLEIDSPLVDVWGRPLHRVAARLGNRRLQDGWTLDVRSQELTGQIEYLPAGNGLLRANLSRAVLNLAQKGASANGSAASEEALTPSQFDSMDLPALDIRVGELVYKGKVVGRVDMKARRDGGDWVLDPLKLTAKEGALDASLRVKDADTRGKSVQSRFRIDSGDVGALLAKLGLDDTFRKGEGWLSGNLSWPGGLSDAETRSLSGDMSIDVKNGRFAKVDPGAARLLGVLSLQSLSRRVKLDFTDVFSDGFAFDSITGSANIRKGVFISDNVQMKGPAADARLSGQVNLVSETQNVKIRVQPHLAESVALAAGAALLNPVVGVAALAAQKVLQDPVGKILSVDYAITGPISNPQINKLGLESRQDKRTTP